MADTQIYYLFKRVALRFSIFIGLLLLFLFSCTSQKENQLLLHADSLMAEYPDSALIFLESIPFPQKLSRADRALYALLLTQARYKNYITLDDDSLIKVAVDYYGKKKSLRAAQAHYYWGAAYRDMGNVPFAVEEYLKAIELMPEKDDFLAMIYDNLAECYLEEDLYDVAMEAYKKAYQILHKDKEHAYYPLRGMAHVFLVQNQLDSALCYFQKAYDCVLVTQDSSQLPILYNDFAIVYKQKKEYVRANEYISKVISMLKSDELDKVYRHKGEIMFALNQPDSARYYFDWNKDVYDIYGRAARYNGLYQVEKKLGNWEAAVQNADAYMVLYDSIQELSDKQQLDELMDNHQLAEQKQFLLHRGRLIMGSLIAIFIFLVFTGGLLFLWIDRSRKKNYILLQQELVQNRVDTMLLRENKIAKSEEERINTLSELRDQQLQICFSMFQSTESYKKLQGMENAKPKELIKLRAFKPEINATIRKTFIDVMSNLGECCPASTNDDLFYCILSLLGCSKAIIMELMAASSDALKSRKSRIKSKMYLKLFDSIFISDNQ